MFPSPVDNRVQRGLEDVLSTFAEVRRTTPYGVHRELWPMMEALRRSLEELPSLQRHPNVKVSWSLGAGNWARVPWIALMDERETTSTQRGTYVVFLFPEDLSGVYITLNQGVTDIIKEQGRTSGRAALAAKADPSLRGQSSSH